MNHNKRVSNRSIRIKPASAACACLAFVQCLQAQAATPPGEQCIVAAAQYHHVNQHVLRAILSVESRLNPTAVNKNANGTYDIGIGQINSVHFKELARFGVQPAHLRDACVGTYVSAWHLAKVQRKYGNTWFGVAAYHSTTPYFNRRYQILISNELVRSGIVAGRLLEVPPLKPIRSQ